MFEMLPPVADLVSTVAAPPPLPPKNIPSRSHCGYPSEPAGKFSRNVTSVTTDKGAFFNLSPISRSFRIKTLTECTFFFQKCSLTWTVQAQQHRGKCFFFFYSTNFAYKVLLQVSVNMDSNCEDAV